MLRLLLSTRVLGALALAILALEMLGTVRLFASEPGADFFEGKAVGAESSFYADTNGVVVLTPRVSGSLKKREFEARGSYVADVISAASVDIVSTASGRWQELRQEGNLRVEREGDASRLRFSGGASVEPDYVSLNAGVLASLELDGANRALGFGYAFGADQAGKSGTPFSVYSQEYFRHVLALTLAQTLDKRTQLLLELNAFLEAGDSKKPYRLLPLFSAAVAESMAAGASIAEVNQVRLPGRVTEAVPGERNRFALTTRLLRRMDGWTFQSFARVYGDDWALFSLSGETRASLDCTERLRLVLHARGVAQTGVFFWRRAYVGSVGEQGEVTVPLYRTGDRELSPLFGVSGGTAVRYALGGDGAFSSGFLGLFVVGNWTHFVDTLFLRERAALLLGVDWEHHF